jgi:integrase
MKILTPEQIASLAGAINQRYRALIILKAYAGLRIAEIAGLRRHRIDLLRGHVRVAEIAVEVQGRIFTGPPKTKAGRRTVPIPRHVVDELQRHLAVYADLDPEGLVFPGADGGVLRSNAWRRRVWKPAIDIAGVAPLRPHDLRHTAVSLWIAAGANPKQVAVWAGHRSVSSVLDRYGHLFPGDESPVLERLAAIAGPAAHLAATANVLPFRQPHR